LFLTARLGFWHALLQSPLHCLILARREPHTAKTPKRAIDPTGAQVDESAFERKGTFCRRERLTEYYHGDEHVTGTNDGGNATAQRYSLEATPSASHVAESANGPLRGAFEAPVDVRTAARFLGVSASLVYAYVERKQIPHFRMMGRTIRFRLSELARWRQQFHVDGGIDE